MSLTAGAILGIISLITSLASATASGVSRHKQKEAYNEQMENQKEIDAYNEKQRKREWRDARRRALARAIGSENVYGPGAYTKAPDRYIAPYDKAADVADTFSSISSVAGSGAGLAGGLGGGASAGGSSGGSSGFQTDINASGLGYNRWA